MKNKKIKMQQPTELNAALAKLGDNAPHLRRLPTDCMLLASEETRRQLKLISAITGETMKGCLARLVLSAYLNVNIPAAKS